MTQIRLGLVGVTGRVGRVTLETALLDERFRVVAALSTKDDPLCGQSVRVGAYDIAIVSQLDNDCDVLVDFSNADGTMSWLHVCRERGIAMVIGATGHDENQLRQLYLASKEIPIVKAPNCSTGVAALLGVVGKLAQMLGEQYDIEIVETHHRHKVDAPSGTALALRDAIIGSRVGEDERDVVYGRRGETGVRPRGQIGIHAVRMGDAVGLHEVHFSGCGETLTLHHEAQSRQAFALGAMRAAAWISDKSPSWYTMNDVLGLQTL